MKWQDFQRSDNVDIDCLGKRVNIKSPEASAAFACQEEVSQLREAFVKNVGLNSESIFTGELAFFSERQKSRDQAKKDESNGFLSFISPFKSDTPSKDSSFPDRVNSFAKQLSVYSDPVASQADKHTR